MAEPRQSAPDRTALETILRRAREAEASRYDVRLAFNDAKLLRLAALKDELAADFAAVPPGLIAPDIASDLDSSPRLWIDLVTSVAMEPDPATYRLISDLETGREVLCESPDREQLLTAVRTYIAHRMVAAARRAGASAAVSPSQIAPGRFWMAMALAFAAGAAAAMAISMLLKSLAYY